MTKDEIRQLIIRTEIRATCERQRGDIKLANDLDALCSVVRRAGFDRWWLEHYPDDPDDPGRENYSPAELNALGVVL